MAYCFRLKFRMVTTLDLPTQDAVLDVPALGQSATIRSNKPRVPGVDQWLSIKSCGYNSEEQARAAALRLKDAFLIIGANGLGADFGTDRATSQMSETLKQKAKDEFNTIIRDDVHGIDVFEDGLVQHFTFGAHVSVQTDVPDLSQRLITAMQCPALTSTTRTGLELINDSLFPMPNEARFLLRISAVEAMSEQGQRSPAVLKLIDELIKVIPWLSGRRSAVDAMRQILRDQRRQGVGQACRAKLRLRLGQPTAKRFAELYDLRSKYVHEGKGRGTFQQAAAEAYDIARRLLDAEINGTIVGPADQTGDQAERERRTFGKRAILAWRVLLGRAT